MVSSFDTVDSRRKYDPTYHLRLTDIITLPTRPNLVGRGTEAALLLKRRRNFLRIFLEAGKMPGTHPKRGVHDTNAA